MNNDRRKTIREIQAKLIELTNLISELDGPLGDVQDAEQEYLDDMPESMQNGEKGERAQAVLDALESARSSCEAMSDAASEINDYLEEAAQ